MLQRKQTQTLRKTNVKTKQNKTTKNRQEKVHVLGGQLL